MKKFEAKGDTLFYCKKEVKHSVGKWILTQKTVNFCKKKQTQYTCRPGFSEGSCQKSSTGD